MLYEVITDLIDFRFPVFVVNRSGGKDDAERVPGIFREEGPLSGEHGDRILSFHLLRQHDPRHLRSVGGYPVGIEEDPGGDLAEYMSYNFV